MEQGYQTSLGPNNGMGEYNAMRFIVAQMLSQMHTACFVQVVACTNSGGVTPVGSVDVQPLVNYADGFGNSVKPGQIYSLPYMRMQGGANAIIMDPQIGDIGIALFAERDSSRVVSTKKQANPGSNRQFDLADGLYLGGWLNGAPSQYVEFAAGGISVVSPTAVTIKAPAVNIENAGSALETLLNSTLLTWLESHIHTGVNGPTSAPTTAPASTVQTTILKAE